ncbi:hypothetical protein ACJRO7_033738, partial [Eucalyptus globulus]
GQRAETGCSSDRWAKTQRPAKATADTAAGEQGCRAGEEGSCCSGVVTGSDLLMSGCSSEQIGTAAVSWGKQAVAQCRGCSKRQCWRSDDDRGAASFDCRQCRRSEQVPDFDCKAANSTRDERRQSVRG